MSQISQTDPDGLEIHDVDFIQTDGMTEGTGTLVIEMTLDDEREVTRIHRNVPEHLYEAWEQHDFDPEMYVAEIEDAFPFDEEEDEEADLAD